MLEFINFVYNYKYKFLCFINRCKKTNNRQIIFLILKDF